MKYMAEALSIFFILAFIFLMIYMSENAWHF